MQFNYIVRDKQGEVHTGALKAPSIEDAVAVLQASDFVVISCQPAEVMPLWIR